MDPPLIGPIWDPPGGDEDGDGEVSLDEGLSDLTDVSDKLVTIAKNPQNFILGTLASVLIGGILDIWNIAIDAVRMVFVGESPGYSPGELVGLEDIPLLLWNVISTPFGSVGGTILGTIETIQATTESLASGLGIASYPITVGFIVLTLVAAQRLAGKLSRATLASIPLIGPALEVFIFE